ncbi:MULTISPECIES: class I SAM-dependent RNA methyltransferase [unclassified Sphingomonas]|jgi:23S rRNA (uracil1939-C5)-methyltransferase|uniref:class I SAM-dependent RNA methyltransferase n=2 Tax=Sphingomonas TaxID=13687 RepID=UPI000B16EAD0|nr:MULTISPECIES: class I SAM-dependent RNA methyltransferase [unclassified Sphingomonas]
MSMTDPEPAAATVVRVAARGEGVTADGRHVSHAAPGDHVAPDGTLVRGPHHQTPPCRHFPECGGCQLQHLDDAAYAAFVAARVTTALAAQDLEAPVRAPILSPPHSRRRATLHAERRGRQVHLGFAEARSHRLIDIAECPILDPRLFALVQPLRGLLAAMLPRSGRVDVHLALADQGPDVLVTGHDFEGLRAAEAITAFALRHGLARFAVDDGMGPESRFEPEPVTITLAGVPVALPPAAFLQATADGEAALAAAAREVASGATTVADLFAGLGTFTFAMPATARVYAAEGARDAVLALKAAGNAMQRRVFVEHRDLYRRPLDTAELERFDCVLLDPPRAGAREQATALAASRVRRIGYISCNPSTFVRDAKMLCEGGHRLDWVQPVGQFRWSTHVELAAQFSRD